MTDDIKDRGAQDRSRVNVNEPHKVRYWTQKYMIAQRTAAQSRKWENLPVVRD